MRHWICKDGRRLRLQEMTLAHLISSMLKIERENWRRGWLPEMRRELVRRRKELQ